MCLFSTKRLIVDVIRFQPGETLTEILDSTAGTEQVRFMILANQVTTADLWTHNKKRIIPVGCTKYHVFIIIVMSACAINTS